MDRIHIKDIRCYGYIGALPEEHILGQWFWVDLTLWLDLSIAGTTDRLDDTLDYCDIIETVQSLVKTQRLMLLERLAILIIEAIFNYPQVTQVQTIITKPHAPIPDFSGRVVIDMTRRRDEMAPNSVH
jgi:7,8-dihydroneopterin aldolase/epimerase/oxygenase